MQHRNTPNAIGLSPNQRLFSRDTRSDIPRITNKLQPPKSATVKERITEKRQVTKASYDKRSKDFPELRVGDNVFVQRRPDVMPDWEKATLLRKLPDKSCEVETEDGGIYRRSAIHVKPGRNVYGRENQNGERRDPDQSARGGSTNRVFERYSYSKQHDVQDNDEASYAASYNDETLREATNREEVRQQTTSMATCEGRPKREIRLPAKYSDFVT